MGDTTTKVVTGKVRASYAHVFVPSAMEEGQDKKYSLCILIDKTDKVTVNSIKKAIKQATEDGKGKLGKITATNLKNPLRDGDDEREDDENYAGCYFINANSNKKPTVLDIKKMEIMLDEDFADRIKRKTDDEIQEIESKRSDEEFYSGCYCRASVNFYAFNVKGNKGIACGLNHVQKLEDGEDLGGGRTSADEDFGEDFDDLM